MIEVFVEQVSARLKYTFDFVLTDHGIDFCFTNDFRTFQNATNMKLNYSERHFDNVVQLVPASLLFEEKISAQKITKSVFGSEECLAFDGVTDPFASIFYVLSRYEEYGDITTDEHDRFPASRSLQFEFGWLQKMMCERWSREIMIFLGENGLTNSSYQPRELKLIPTFDIDNTYAYQLKIGSRKLLSTLKDYTKRDKVRLEERKRVLAGEEKDPYDTFDTIESIAKRWFDVKLFWLLGDYGKFDRNISHENIEHRKLIQQMSRCCEVGIHPSYKSNTLEIALSDEIQRLSTIISREVLNSRQHFLKMRFPATYERLLEQGITNDYTMGFASEIGFRAGTSRPFHWFNLKKNEVTDLVVHPFSYMDGTLLEYKNWSITQAKQEIQSLFDEFKQFGGEFIFLWHNETIGDYGKWKGWSEVLEFSLGLNKKIDHE